MILRTLAAATAALGLACSAPASSHEQWFGLSNAGGGVWEARGYGWVIDLNSDTPRLFHQAGPYCYAAPDDQLAEDDSFAFARIADGGDLLTTSAPGRTEYRFHRLPALPSSCGEKRVWSPGDIATLVERTFADLYAGFGPRERSRAGLSRALQSAMAATDDQALYAALASALAGLDDAHVSLAAAIDGEEREFESGEAPSLIAAAADATLGRDGDGRLRAWSARYREGLVDLLDGGGHFAANRRILWGRIGRVGYINVLTMGGFAPGGDAADTRALDMALDDAFRDFRGADGVIVDVSNNRGGYDWVSLALASRFADAPRVAFTKQAGGAAPQTFTLRPGAAPGFRGPVALVTSDITVSAGEVFTLAMRALPQVTHWGGTTRGALSDQLSKPLPNGWTLTLPAELYRQPDGVAPEGRGIAPTRRWPPGSGARHRDRIAWLARRIEGGTAGAAAAGAGVGIPADEGGR